MSAGQHRPARSPKQPGRPRGRRRLFAVAVALVSATIVAGCGRGRVRTQASIEALAADPARDAWQLPAEVLARAGVTAGARVADYGAGDGYWLPHLARAVAPTGSVIAIEFDAALVAGLRGKVRASGLTTVAVHQAEEGELPGSQPLDRVLLLDSYGALAEPVGTLERLRSRLAPGGALVVLGHRVDAAIPGPPLPERLDVETIVAEARGAGFGEPSLREDLARQWLVVLPLAAAPTAPPP